MYWVDTPSDGIYALLPAKTRGESGNTFSSSKVTSDLSGTVVIDGAGSATIGVYDSLAQGATFIPYSDGLITGNSAFVNHGVEARLAVSITGTTASSRVGYAGGSQ